MKLPCFLIGVLISAYAQAEGACDKATTTIDTNQCLQTEYDRSDKKLNTAYQAALKRMESWIDNSEQQKETKQGFVEAQRLWVKFRDKDCGTTYNLWQDGTIRTAMYLGCMTAHTESRTKELELFAKGH